MPARGRGSRRTSGAGPDRRAALRPWLPVLLLSAACEEAAPPSAQACAEILALQRPAAEVVETWLGAGSVTLDYRLAEDGAESSHRLECSLAETASGRLRARSLRLDGHELSEAELLLVNSELLLAEIRRADPGAPRSARRAPLWLARLLPRS